MTYRRLSGNTKATYDSSAGTLTITNGSQTASLSVSSNFTNATWVLSNMGAFQGCEWRDASRRPSSDLIHNFHPGFHPCRPVSSMWSRCSISSWWPACPAKMEYRQRPHSRRPPQTSNSSWLNPITDELLHPSPSTNRAERLRAHRARGRAQFSRLGWYWSRRRRGCRSFAPFGLPPRHRPSVLSSLRS